MDASRDKVVAEDASEASKPIVGARTISSGIKDDENIDPIEKTSKSAEGSMDQKCAMSKDATGLKTLTRIPGGSLVDVADSSILNELASTSGNRQCKDVEEEEARGDHLDIPDKDLEDVSLKSVSDGDNSVFSDNPDAQLQQQRQSTDQPKPNDQSENESEELDDIELIFTTDDTCRDLGLQEDLVSITEAESWPQTTTTGQPVMLKYTKSAEGESLVCNGEKTSSVEEAVSSRSSSIDREESVDRFDESSSSRLNKMWSQCSVLVETDISKCGVVEESKHATRHAVRRNTLAAPPTAYR